jgi:hypothetical protein
MYTPDWPHVKQHTELVHARLCVIYVYKHHHMRFKTFSWQLKHCKFRTTKLQRPINRQLRATVLRQECSETYCFDDIFKRCHETVRCTFPLWEHAAAQWRKSLGRSDRCGCRIPVATLGLLSHMVQLERIHGSFENSDSHAIHQETRPCVELYT